MRSAIYQRFDFHIIKHCGQESWHYTAFCKSGIKYSSRVQRLLAGHELNLSLELSTYLNRYTFEPLQTVSK